MDNTTLIRIGGALLVAFLFGSFPTSYIIGRVFYGVDPRKHGSGGSGATNSLRTLGAKAAAVVALVDILKGYLACTVVGMVIVPPEFGGLELTKWALVGACVFAILGHAFSPWIGFRGGKGVATGAGALLAMMPGVFFIELAFFIAIVAISRYVSLASIILAMLLPLWVCIFYPSTPFVVLAFTAAALVIWLHRSNIKRLLAGEENRLSFKHRGVAVRKSTESSEGE